MQPAEATRPLRTVQRSAQATSTPSDASAMMLGVFTAQNVVPERTYICDAKAGSCITKGVRDASSEQQRLAL